MPITITLPQPVEFLGPGALISWSSDFIGALPTGSRWVVNVSDDAEFLNNAYVLIQPTSVVFGGWLVGDTTAFQATVAGPGRSIDSGTTTHVQVRLQEPAGGGTFTTVDSGTDSAQWRNDRAAGQLLPQLIGSLRGGGLTSTQSTLLTQTHDNTVTDLSNWSTFTSVTLPSLNDLITSIVTGITASVEGAAGIVPTSLGTLFSGKTLDLVTTADLSGGDTCDPVDVDISGSAMFGVQLVVTTWPAWWPFTAPDLAWSIPDLAVLTITRGGAIVARHGIHTLSHTVYPLPGLPILPVVLSLPVVPGDYHVSVVWAPGVCGHLTGLGFP